MSETMFMVETSIVFSLVSVLLLPVSIQGYYEIKFFINRTHGIKRLRTRFNYSCIIKIDRLVWQSEGMG